MAQNDAIIQSEKNSEKSENGSGKASQGMQEFVDKNRDFVSEQVKEHRLKQHQDGKSGITGQHKDGSYFASAKDILGEAAHGVAKAIERILPPIDKPEPTQLGSVRGLESKPPDKSKSDDSPLGKIEHKPGAKDKPAPEAASAYDWPIDQNPGGPNGVKDKKELEVIKYLDVGVQLTKYMSEDHPAQPHIRIKNPIDNNSDRIGKMLLEGPFTNQELLGCQGQAEKLEAKLFADAQCKNEEEFLKKTGWSIKIDDAAIGGNKYFPNQNSLGGVFDQHKFVRLSREGYPDIVMDPWANVFEVVPRGQNYSNYGFKHEINKYQSKLTPEQELVQKQVEKQENYNRKLDEGFQQITKSFLPKPRDKQN